MWSGRNKTKQFKNTDNSGSSAIKDIRKIEQQQEQNMNQESQHLICKQIGIIELAESTGKFL